MKKYSDEQKSKIINKHLHGETVTKLSQETGIARSTLYQWINDYNSKIDKNRRVNIGDYKKLKQHSEKLENIITIIKTTDSFNRTPLHERFEEIKKLSDKYSINTLCEALSVAKGSYYNHILRNKNGNTLAAKRRAELTVAIEEIFHDNKQIFGSKKITPILREKGYSVSPLMVTEIMHKNGWFSIRGSAKKKYLQNLEWKKKNILNQNFNTSHPNEVWVSDVTYFKLNRKTYYICVVLDLFSRKIIAYNISGKNSTQLTKSTFKKAYESRDVNCNLLFHSDQGANFTSKSFMQYLRNLNVQQSFSRPGTPYDNSVCETFFSNLKQEELYRTKYRSENELKKSVKEYIEFYNTKRPHKSLSYRTPDKAESDFYNEYAD